VLFSKLADLSTPFCVIDKPPSNELPEGQYPYQVEKDAGGITLCVQAFFFSKYLGNLRVNFSTDGIPVSWDGQPILLDHRVPKGLTHLYIHTHLIV